MAIGLGKLTLADLAGPEASGKGLHTEGESLREVQAINRSLTALGDVFQVIPLRFESKVVGTWNLIFSQQSLDV